MGVTACVPLRPGRARPAGLLAGLLAIAGIAGCIHEPPRIGGKPSAPAGAGEFWSAPAGVAPAVKPAAPPRIPEDLLKRKDRLALADIVDLALANNPATRASWANARAAAAAYGSRLGAWWPTIELDAAASYSKTTTLIQGQAVTEQSALGPQASLSYLLLDFGGRSGAIEGARQTLFATDWTHNATVQNVVLQVEAAYYQYMATQALLVANKASFEDARAQLEAADERHKVGVATIADVLQAKTALSQAQLAVDTTTGLVQTTRGALAVAMGLPANLPYDVEEMPKDVSFDGISMAVEQLIQEAVEKRPDLAAARAQAAAARANVKTAWSACLPTLSVNGSFGRSWYKVDNLQDSYSGTIDLNFPLFTGFSNSYDLMQAEEQAKSAESQSTALEQSVIYQVWSSYYGLLTAAQQVRTTGDLLASAEESHQVAMGRYKEGVGSILDLLTAESNLADARAQRIKAKWGWHLSLAQLAHDTGLLDIHGSSNLLPSQTDSPDTKP